jgi:hypothetical protein
MTSVLSFIESLRRALVETAADAGRRKPASRLR